jgi:hypothetical protein
MPTSAAPRRDVADLDLPVQFLEANLNCTSRSSPYWRPPLDHTIHYNTTLRSPFAVPTLVLS